MNIGKNYDEAMNLPGDIADLKTLWGAYVKHFTDLHSKQTRQKTVLKIVSLVLDIVWYLGFVVWDL